MVHGVWVRFIRRAFCPNLALVAIREFGAVAVAAAGIGIHSQKLWSGGLPAACTQHDSLPPGSYQLRRAHHALRSPARCAISSPISFSPLLTAALAPSFSNAVFEILHCFSFDKAAPF